jgi:hypothetical protein
MFGAAGTLLNSSVRAQNQGKVRLSNHIRARPLTCIVPSKPVRYNLDAWDEMMMKRDERLTGHLRGQTVRLPLFLHRNTYPSLPVYSLTQ